MNGYKDIKVCFFPQIKDLAFHQTSHSAEGKSAEAIDKENRFERP
jgi:hypothetical protein